MSAPVDVLAVMEAESNRRLSNYNAAVRGDAPEALADRLHADLHEMATARAAVAELIEAKRQLDGIKAMCGYVQDGSCQFFSIGQDDATHEWCVNLDRKYFASGPTFGQALNAALARVQGGAA